MEQTPNNDTMTNTQIPGMDSAIVASEPVEKQKASKKSAKDLARKRAKKLNHPQIFLTLFLFVSLFVAMTIYLIVYVKDNEVELINNSYNPRQEVLLSQNYRGTIYSRDGEVLAYSEVDDNQNETRIYPYNDLFSHAVGYSTHGRMGVEALANYYLINTNVSVSTKVANDVAGKKNPGDNVYTTLDVELQQIADQYLNVFKGAVVVTEVKTGKVLCMLSHPGFNPNEIDSTWNSLMEDNDSTVLLNRVTQGLYPPGSTFKILTALEYYRENGSDYTKYRFNCPGYYTVDGERINCYHGQSHGSEDFAKSFAKSCNSSFANIGMSLDRKSFAQTLSDLKFGADLPCALPTATSSAVVSEGISTEDMMQTSIGQGKTTMSPIHLNMITCAIANKGILMKPYLIDKVVSAENTSVKTFKSEAQGRLLTADESEFLTEMMIGVVESGTATKLDGLSYTAAGKTGSAEYNGIKGDSHAWFTGFAPAEDPEIAVTIIVEGAGSGGDYAVPLAKRLFDSYFEQKNNGTN